jgi:phosphoesterase RecJ-like protein
LCFFADRRIAVLVLTARDFLETGATESMTEGIVNYAIEIEGVWIAVLVRESGPGIKCSLRAKNPFDVSRVAASFGGGGHAQAAGCTLSRPLDDAVQRLIRELEEAL